MAMPDNPSLQSAEAEVQSHSAVLRRELGLLDLILAQILLVVVPDFFGTAVKAGPAHVVSARAIVGPVSYYIRSIGVKLC